MIKKKNNKEYGVSIYDTKSEQTQKKTQRNSSVIAMPQCILQYGTITLTPMVYLYLAFSMLKTKCVCSL